MIQAAQLAFLALLLAHLVGDFLFQPKWLAENKGKRLWPLLCHGFVHYASAWACLLIFASTNFLSVYNQAVIAGYFLAHLLIDKLKSLVIAHKPRNDQWHTFGRVGQNFRGRKGAPSIAVSTSPHSGGGNRLYRCDFWRRVLDSLSHTEFRDQEYGQKLTSTRKCRPLCWMDRTLSNDHGHSHAISGLSRPNPHGKIDRSLPCVRARAIRRVLLDRNNAERLPLSPRRNALVVSALRNHVVQIERISSVSPPTSGSQSGTVS